MFMQIKSDLFFFDFSGVFNNINRFYKRHTRRSDNEPASLNTKTNFVTNDADKLNKLENIQLTNSLNALNSLNGLNYAENKNKNW